MLVAEGEGLDTVPTLRQYPVQLGGVLDDEEAIVPGVYRDILEDLRSQTERLVNVYEQDRQKGRLDGFFKAAPSLAAIAAVLALFTQLPSINGTLDEVVQGDVPNVQNQALSRARFETASASSYRQDLGGTVHRPLNVLDNNPTTGWAECRGGDPVHEATTRVLATGRNCDAGGAGEMAGTGEWIRLPLTSPVELKFIRIRNGYQKREELFLRNPRVRKLTITLEDESGNSLPPQTEELLDEPGYQTLGLLDDDRKVSAVVLTIVSSYPGEEYMNKEAYLDTTISDIELIPDEVVKPGE